ncbi:uncharacterized protein [Haliotis cracherodii]|uniref:uncharacterized protein n=1 Tax=Haliotis cracherodii TaxID=6455 RepID=UPI0039E74A64
MGPRIEKQDTNMRKALPPGLKLIITVRFLASGDKYPSLMYSVARNTISLIIHEVCQAIVEEYKDEMASMWPSGNQSSSLYHNYKGFFSVALMALADGDYKFLWVNISAYGSVSDAQIFNELNDCLEDGSKGFPETSPIPQDDEHMPYFILGDDAFGIRTFLMKPHGHMNLQRAESFCNYRKSRSRCMVENAFGILVQRWQVLLTTMEPKPSIVQDIVECCVCQHNLMMIRYPALHNSMVDEEDDKHNVVPGALRQLAQLEDVQCVAGGTRDT